MCLTNYLFLSTFRTGRTYFLSAPFIAAEAQHHEERHLIYGPLESSLLNQGFPVKYELDAWNLLHTRTPLSYPLTFAISSATRNSAQTSSYLIPGQHYLETFMSLFYSNQDHIFMDDYIIPVLNQQT